MQKIALSRACDLRIKFLLIQDPGDLTVPRLNHSLIYIYHLEAIIFDLVQLPTSRRTPIDLLRYKNIHPLQLEIIARWK